MAKKISEKLSDFSSELVKEFKSVAREVVPDGRPLDDEWPAMSGDVAGLLEERFPNIFDDGQSHWDLINEIVGTCNNHEN